MEGRSPIPKASAAGQSRSWTGDESRDLVTYRLLVLGWAASVHSGKQDDIAERIGRNSDILVHLSDEGFTGLIPQAILEFDGGERLFLGRVENRRNAYLMYCRTAGFSTVVQVSLDETRQELVAGHVRLFNGDVDLAGEWAERLADRLRRGELRPAPASEGDSHGSGRERLAARIGRLGGQRNRHRYKRSSVFCAGKVRTETDEYECDILNISASGAQIRMLKGVKPPQTFTLSMERFGEFRCRVMRETGDKYGVAFEESAVDIEHVVEDIINHPERTNEIRKYPRRLVLLSGAVYMDNRPIECRVLDISSGGARIRVDEPFEHDDTFPLMIYRFGEFPTEVAWEKDTDIGVVFIDDPAQIERLIGHLLPAKTRSARRR